MKAELHAFIIWNRAYSKREEILKDIVNRFDIVDIYNVFWTDKNFSRNMSRFYGQKLPKNSSKEKHCGKGPLTLIIVKVEESVYEKRLTTRGIETVNVKIFDAKTLYRKWTRKWTGTGHRIHATNTPAETAHDLTLLLGESYSRYENRIYKTWNGNEIEWKQDLAGANGWKNLEQFFYVLNHTANYLVLRNFKNLPNEPYMAEHGDIDMLCDNLLETSYVANAKKVFNRKNRVYYNFCVGSQEIFLDLRYIGDDYYDKKWEEKLLRNKIMHNKFFYIPDSHSHFYTLLYHAFIHKRYVKKEYIDELAHLAGNLGLSKITTEFLRDKKSVKVFIDNYLDSKKYVYTEPKDTSVYFNQDFVKTMKFTLNRKLYMKASAFKNFAGRTKSYLLNITESFYWLIIYFHKFKFFLKEKYGVNNLRPLNFKEWHNGSFHFSGFIKEKKIFIKTDFFFALASNEIKALEILWHDKKIIKHLPKVVIFNIEGCFRFIGFEYIEGQPLNKMLIRNLSDINKKQLIEHMTTLLEGLHRNNVLHRDIRPDNFIVTNPQTNEYNLVLVDFAFAKGVNDKEALLPEISATDENLILLKWLGRKLKPGKYLWDDAYSLLRTIDIIDKEAKFKFADNYSVIESTIHKLDYHFHPQKKCN